MTDPLAVADQEKIPDLKLETILDGQNDRGIPQVKFLDDIDAFSKTFDPPASAELLIGAYSDIFSKFKSYEASLTQKREFGTQYCPQCGAWYAHLAKPSTNDGHQSSRHTLTKQDP